MRRYVPRRGWYRRRPVAPPPPTAYEKIVEERGPDPYAGGPPVGDPFGPGPRPTLAPWARNVWFWLLLLGIVVAIGVLVLLAASADDEGRGRALALVA